ncbi:MAG: D-alanyl-D-alanine carboxypeptidase, partial [Phycisphaerales bacterium]
MPVREFTPRRESTEPLHRRLLCLFVAALVGSTASGPACATPAATTPQAATRSDLASEVRAAVLASKLNPGAIGYTILDCHGETVLAASNATLPLIPASNLKALTTAAAIDMLGERFAFETRLVLTRNGDRTTLTLVGSGDPALFDPEVLGWSGPRGNWTTVDAAIDAWSGALLAAGVRRVDEFVVDG